MKLLLNAKVYGWRMTGLMGRGGAWFFGYSQRPNSTEETADRNGKEIASDTGLCDATYKAFDTTPNAH